ncbi:BLUF domain-containing protein [Hydrogenophaga sp.]|uniref:BLUF domain-containing protein n=1 Tax=Hydrogenophaga sp. TaxID=1904254 RepID=UPI003F6AEEF3
MLERLLYQSTARHAFGALHLFSLLTTARLRNSTLDITGHLLYLDGKFVQCLEGPPHNLDLVWASVQRDPRHHSIELLARGPISQRRFAQWSMSVSSDESLYVHGTTGFFPVDKNGVSPLLAHCQLP